MRILTIAVLLSVSQGSLAQTNCTCCTDFHKQFDFWVGDWIVNDTTGTKVGENLIIKLEDDCLINEHWQGAGGSTGRSYNYFNLSDSTWNQVWVDNSGSNLILKGKAKENQMILKGELIEGTRIDWYRNRITWTKNDDGTVTQLWEILDKNDKLLSVAFKGIYNRK